MNFIVLRGICLGCTDRLLPHINYQPKPMSNTYTYTHSLTHGHTITNPQTHMRNHGYFGIAFFYFFLPIPV